MNEAIRRRGFFASTLVATLAAAFPAWAGSYLDRASFLVFEANAELSAVRRKLHDEEFARVVHHLTAARVRAAREMMVPSEVVQAHPHLLLLLENAERATRAAVERKPKEFVKFLELARDEERLFRGILKQLGWELPKFRES